MANQDTDRSVVTPNTTPDGSGRNPREYGVGVSVAAMSWDHFRSETMQLMDAVVDRLIQQAMHQVLSPVFDPFFSDHSYGFRPGRSAHHAVLRARDYVAGGRRWIVDMDLEKFFGAPGQAWHFQRVKFPSRQGVESPHRESSLSLMEVTT